MSRAYAIGDVHGQLGKLRQAHALIDEDRRRAGDDRAPVIHLGDLVDRGPDSRGVIQFLVDGLAAGAPWLVLKGNHDRLFARYLADPLWADNHLRDGYDWLHPALGGRQTLASYGVASAETGDPAEAHAETLARVPAAHVAFLKALPLWHRVGQALFVHAGIRPGIAIKAQAEDDLVWIRAPFLDHTGDHGVLVVHGHTTVEAATHYGNRLNLDSGAGYGGPVSAAVIEGRSAWLLTETGRLPIDPVCA
ncbi:MAG: metallophosphoesterase [Rhodobacteraceae bacterium]|nr:metallophosphoesterase [Paracoccaceae bacterium]